MKLTLDFVGGTVLLIFFSPVMIVAALAIKLTSPGPVLFRSRVAHLHAPLLQAGGVPCDKSNHSAARAAVLDPCDAAFVKPDCPLRMSQTPHDARKPDAEREEENQRQE